ncbi:MAG: hydrogenase expression/formation protein HypE [Acidobacteria bacterium]|nr:hydrogenase expression/formation protein HypE [Acidobacteriota bacterium]
MKEKKIILGHGSGGRLSRELIEEIISPHLGNRELFGLNDGALLHIEENDLAFTTDSYIIDPVFFPGGDIGKLAVAGTVNDLLMVGATPKFISLSFIIEEGFSIVDLEKILVSIKKTAEAADVKIATGDTKILPRGKGDKIFINTSGIGLRITKQPLTPERVKEGDKIIVTGTLGDHSAAVMIAREGLSVNSNILSDCAELTTPLLDLFKQGYNIKCMRDPTRGGLAAVLTEIICGTEYNAKIDEREIPVRDDVLAVCEVLGLDPLYMANEGKAVIIAEAAEADKITSFLKNFPVSAEASVIGEIEKGDKQKGKVILMTVTGGERLVVLPHTEQLPRIC